jgi:hypothetical protein
MVSAGYHNVGEEWAQKLTFRRDRITRDTTVTVVLFDDSVDQLTDASDVSDITTQPTTGNYAPVTFQLDSTDITVSDQNNDDTRAEASVTFDLNNTSDNVDSAGLIVDFQSDIVNTESGQNPHLIYTAPLDNAPVDTSTFSAIEVNPQLDLD